MKNPHYIIIIPGLGDNVKAMKLATSWWKKYDMEVVVHYVGWRDGSKDFEKKLNEVISLVDELSKKGKVSVVGTSAGGSLAFNTFIKRSDKINKAISICGRLKKGNHKIRSLDKKSSSSETFKQSVLLFEENISKLTADQKSRMMTVSARFGDELVPADTSYIEGIYNVKIPTAEHLISIGSSLTLFSKRIIKFVLSNK